MFGSPPTAWSAGDKARFEAARSDPLALRYRFIKAGAR
jgi:hypothetical protein